jgi:hypothetical protein
MADQTNDSPANLRRQAEHCRTLAGSPCTERTRVILQDMAKEFDQQAVASEAAQTKLGQRLLSTQTCRAAPAHCGH